MKTNEFETAQFDYSDTNHRFSNEANMYYTCSSADELLADTSKLETFIKHHQQHQRPRLDILDSYYEGDNVTILSGKRRKEEHLSDHRATHNFAEYVSQFIQGYMVGIPLKTVYPVDEIDEQIKDINRANDADAHNSDLVLDLSIYGRAYELLYRNKRDENRFVQCSPLETFVIYDDTVEAEPIAGVRYIKVPFDTQQNVKVYVYTDSKINAYSMEQSGKLTLESEQEHHFKGVPIIEYRNNRDRRGDFENALSLIDLYDAAQSDTSNFLTDTNDAYLVIKGNVDLSTGEAAEMKKANIILLQPEMNVDGKEGNVDASYIYKQYDVGGTEAYKSRVKADIHLFTSTPDMSDQQFSGVQSGEAMRYKIFSLEQKRAAKERLFKRSLRERYRLLNNMLTTASEGSFDVKDINITFTPNLPKSVKDEVEMFTKLGGMISDETKISLLSFIENPQEELERMEAERPKGLDYAFSEKQE